MTTDKAGWIFGLPMWLDTIAFVFSLFVTASLVVGLPAAIIWWITPMDEHKGKRP